MPLLGLGVYDMHGKETEQAIADALETGYRLIDTATLYANEEGVGRAIRDSGVARDDVFVTTKVWNSDQGYDTTLRAFDESRRLLGLDVVDLYLIHWPAPRLDRYVDTWKALERLYADGHARAIGVSNFTVAHLTRLLDETTVVPAVNQIELHPYFSQPDVQKADAEYGILTQAWSPIGGITFYPGWGENRKNVMRDPVIAGVAQAHGKTPAQVMLRWHLQQGRSAIPKSTNPARIAENFDVFDFELSTAEIEAIDALDSGVRSGPDPDLARPERFAMVIPEA